MNDTFDYDENHQSDQYCANHTNIQDDMNKLHNITMHVLLNWDQIKTQPIVDSLTENKLYIEMRKSNRLASDKCIRAYVLAFILWSIHSMTI